MRTLRSARPGELLRTWDWSLTFAALVLAFLGLLLVWSATAHGQDPAGFVVRHAISLVVALVIGALVAHARHRMLRAWTPVLYLLGPTLLVVVLLVGTDVNGSRSWLHVPGGLSLQPGELAKPAVVLAIAYVFAERADRAEVTLLECVGALVPAALCIGLVLLQPDTGTAVVLVVIAAGCVVLSGLRARFLIAMGIAAAASVVVALASGVLEDYQVARFTAFLDPDSDPRGTGYNVLQAEIAVSSGGFSGTGLFKGPRTAGSFVPEQHTDFIFTVAGEELGFVGAAAIIVLLGFVLWRGVHITRDAPDIFGRLVAGGVVCWLAIQIFENVGMTLGLAPITGVPLPFMSYGGSSLIASFIAVGLLLNVSRAGGRHP